MFRNVRALLFDFDGTLIQQRIDFKRMRLEVLEVVRRYGVPPEPLTQMYVLELIEHVLRVLQDVPERGRAFFAETQQVITEIEVQAAEGACAFPGVPGLLSQLHAWGYKLGIVTRNCRVAVECVLRHNPLTYDVLLTRDDVERVKPDPQHLLAALEVLAVPPERTLMCGDHPMDILVGQRIGAVTVGVLNDGTPEDYFAEVKPDLVVPQVTELRRYLEPLR